MRVDRRIFPGCVTSRGGLRFSPIPDTADASPHHPVDYSACLFNGYDYYSSYNVCVFVEVFIFSRLGVNLYGFQSCLW